MTDKIPVDAIDEVVGTLEPGPGRLQRLVGDVRDAAFFHGHDELVDQLGLLRLIAGAD